MKVSTYSPLMPLPREIRPKIPYLPNAPEGDSSKYDLNNITDQEAAKLGVDMYNDGKISLHELGILQMKGLEIKEDGNLHTTATGSSLKKCSLIEYGEMAVESCRSRGDERGAKIYENLLETLKKTADEPGRKISVSA